MPDDTHEDIRRRLFEAAWEAPAFAPACRSARSRVLAARAALTIFGGGAAVVAAVVAIVLAGGGVPQASRTEKAVGGLFPTGPARIPGRRHHRAAAVFDRLPRRSMALRHHARRLAGGVRDGGRWPEPGVDHEHGWHGLRQLTHDPFEAIDPAWSPDGREDRVRRIR